MCYFNSTRCVDLTASGKLHPMRFIFGDVVYEVKVDAFLRDIKGGRVLSKPPKAPKKGTTYDGGCMFEIKPSKDYNKPEGHPDHHFLMGNTFLKNFVSVYDYDQQSVSIGVNIHSNSLAKAYKYDKKEIDQLII